jgi:hypothetical protein
MLQESVNIQSAAGTTAVTWSWVPAQPAHAVAVSCVAPANHQVGELSPSGGSPILVTPNICHFRYANIVAVNEPTLCHSAFTLLANEGWIK